MSKTAFSPVVVLAERDPQTLHNLEQHVLGWGYSVFGAADVAQLGDRLARTAADLVVLDLELDERPGLATLAEILDQPACPPVVALTSTECMQTAIEAIKMGACDYMAKATNLDQLKRVATRAIKKHRAKHQTGRPDEPAPAALMQIVGSSAPMCRMRDLICDVAVTDAKVLILGESGTGKELVARAVHQQSRRADRVFAPVNMAALPHSLAESVLFGHEKGAFTGADTLQRGWCEMADKGTLFLDEIGEMDLTLQAKLLRFLQDGTFQRVGSSKVQQVDVRIIAATNRDPATLVRDGRLREDVYYRLNVLPIAVPALRDRRDDIPQLADVFLARAAHTHSKRVKHFTPAALDVITSYDWPGNVRQLENTLERLAILARGKSIGVEDLPPEILGGEPPVTSGWRDPAASATNDTVFEMREIEKDAILRALAQSNGNVVKAAGILGIGQATVYRKMKRYGIRIERKHRSDRDEEPTTLTVNIQD